MNNDQALIVKYFLGDYRNVTFDKEHEALSASTALARVLDIFVLPHQLTEDDVLEGFEHLVGKWTVKPFREPRNGRH
jgi:hypothetical protein